MESIYVHGGISLQGQVGIQGSKNAVLPILAATLLTEGVSVFEHCPRLTDVEHMQTLLKCLGCAVVWDKDKLKVDTTGVNQLCMCESTAKCAISGMTSGVCRDAVKGMRSSVFLLGAMLGRMGEALLEYPGGCVIGKRPIDLHIKALEQMHVVFEERAYGIYASTTGLKGTEIILKTPSVGATENLILAGVRAEGITVIEGAAREPEIKTLCDYLKLCGADISGAGSNRLVIQGVKRLHGATMQIPGDRIVAGTYLCACMAASGEVLLKNAPTEEMEQVLLLAEKMGAVCHKTDSGLYVQRYEPLKAVPQIVTAPYPGFPTDMQSLFLVVAALAEGQCLIEENIFENRFHIVPALQDMGADIEVLDASHLQVKGVTELTGFTMEAKELRGGAALVIAAAAAKGESVVDGARFIARGYENICRDLRELGVRIYSV